ncbi:MAG: DUF3138 family protein [Burkholderiales bacterium]
MMAPLPHRWVVPVLSAWALLGSAPAAAEDPEVAALRRQVNALEQQVSDLQARMHKLEGGGAAAAAPQAVPAAVPEAPAAPIAVRAGSAISPEAALRQRWSSIKPTMAHAQVAEVLGQPSTKFKLDGRNVWYYYYPGTGGGSVFFTDEGKVSSSQSPFGWGW